MKTAIFSLFILNVIYSIPIPILDGDYSPINQNNIWIYNRELIISNDLGDSTIINSILSFKINNTFKYHDTLFLSIVRKDSITKDSIVLDTINCFDVNTGTNCYILPLHTFHLIDTASLGYIGSMASFNFNGIQERVLSSLQINSYWYGTNSLETKYLRNIGLIEMESNNKAFGNSKHEKASLIYYIINGNTFINKNKFIRKTNINLTKTYLINGAQSGNIQHSIKF